MTATLEHAAPAAPRALAHALGPEGFKVPRHVLVSPKSSRRRLDTAIVTALVAVVGVVVASGLTRWPAFNGDEGIYTSQSWSVLHGNIEAYTYSYDHPFLGWTLVAPFEWLAQHLDITGTHMAVLNARSVMVVLAMVDAALIYGIARRLAFRRPLACLTVLIWGLSPLTVSYARQVYLDNMALPFLLGALYLALDPARRQWVFITAGCLFAMGVLSKETTLLFLPVLLYTLVQRTSGQLRVMALMSTGTCTIALIGLYPLFALLRNEFFPGPGHVSLWTDQIWDQLFSRAGSGSILDVSSARFQLVDSWMHLDWWLPVAGMVAAALTVFMPRMRPCALAVAVSVATIVKPGGYLPGMFVITALPFLALCVGATLEGLVVRQRGGKRWHRRARRMRRFVRILGVAVVVILVVAMIPEYQAGIRREATVDQDKAALQADHYAVSHIPKSANVLTDPIFYLDLVNAGFRHRWRGAIAYYQFDLDPESFKQLPGGWQDLNYVIVTPAMRDQISGKSVSLPRTEAAIVHSRVIASFGQGQNAVQIREIVHPPARGRVPRGAN